MGSGNYFAPVEALHKKIQKLINFGTPYCPPMFHKTWIRFWFASRICFKFEEENAEKDTEAMKKERFEAVMAMMQVTWFKLNHLHYPLLFLLHSGTLSTSRFSADLDICHRRCKLLATHRRSWQERWAMGHQQCPRSVPSHSYEFSISFHLPAILPQGCSISYQLLPSCFTTHFHVHADESNW